MTKLPHEAEALEETLQKAAILNFGATWHGIAKRQMMAHGICRTIVEELGITREMLDNLPLKSEKAFAALSTLLELAGVNHGE